jgi:hypothetical protein
MQAKRLLRLRATAAAWSSYSPLGSASTGLAIVACIAWQIVALGWYSNAAAIKVKKIGLSRKNVFRRIKNLILFFVLSVGNLVPFM